MSRSNNSKKPYKRRESEKDFENTTIDIDTCPICTYADVLQEDDGIRTCNHCGHTWNVASLDKNS